MIFEKVLSILVIIMMKNTFYFIIKMIIDSINTNNKIGETILLTNALNETKTTKLMFKL